MNFKEKALLKEAETVARRIIMAEHNDPFKSQSGWHQSAKMAAKDIARVKKKALQEAYEAGLKDAAEVAQSWTANKDYYVTNVGHIAKSIAEEIRLKLKESNE